MLNIIINFNFIYFVVKSEPLAVLLFIDNSIVRKKRKKKIIIKKEVNIFQMKRLSFL